ncbi:MAG: DUF2157 domain-containing protein [Gammaproteobacteria bacterium]|nr:DUF2157 domain-containing protein [Gammaproteobacteria bacterium]
MNISRTMLDQAVDQKIINAQQATRLLDFIKQQQANPVSNMIHVLYYLGGLVAIAAMTVFMNLAWTSFGGWGLVALSLSYAVVGLYLTDIFDKKKLVIPAGICATFVICVTPAAIYGLQLAMGWWPLNIDYQDYYSPMHMKWYWLSMELGTLAVGCVLFWVYRYPFMLMPIAMTFWYTAMDLALMIVGWQAAYSVRADMSMYLGAVMIFTAWFVERKAYSSGDYAFWLYFFGVAAYWGGLSSHYSGNFMSFWFYLCPNLIMIGVGAVLARNVFIVFGGIGCGVYLAYLAMILFKDSVFFPIALAGIGLLMIYLGVLWQNYTAPSLRKT